MMAIKRDLIDKIIRKHRTDLVNHLYFIFLEIWKLDQQSKIPKRKNEYLIYTTIELKEDIHKKVIFLKLNKH